MRKESKEAGFIRVAKPQRSKDVPAGLEFSELLQGVAKYLVDIGKYPSVGAAVKGALNESHYYAAINDDASLSRRAVFRFIGQVDDPHVRLYFSEEARTAFLMRRARLQRSFSPIYDLSPYEILAGGAISFKSISDPGDKCAVEEDYWSSLLYRTMDSLDLPLTPVNASNIADLTRVLVDDPRRRHGEAVALRHAIILLYAYLSKQSFADHDLLPSLTMIFVVLDLAAQVNDVFVQRRLVELLMKDLRPCLAGPALDICDRIIHTTASTIIRHSLHFRPGSEDAINSHALTLKALNKLHTATDELGFISDHPRLGLPWVSACFQGIQTSIVAGLPPTEIDRFVALCDTIAEKFRDISPGSRSLKDVWSSKASDIYESDLQGELLLLRPDPTRSLEGPDNEKSWGFDPDRAIVVLSTALDSIDKNSKSADTAVASMRVGLAEAMLCRNVRRYGTRGAARWEDHEREEYKSARSNAVSAFTLLDMRWKLRRLARLELRGAGIDAKQWDMEVLHRKSPRN